MSGIAKEVVPHQHYPLRTIFRWWYLSGCVWPFTNVWADHGIIVLSEG